MIHSTTLEILPDVNFSVQNITHMIVDYLETTGIQRGHLIAFYKHTTGSIIIGEHESGIIADLEDTVEKLAPTDGDYHHHLREVDFNGFAHIRAAFMPTSIVVPIEDGRLVLGTHQEILVIDNQPESFPRYIHIQVSGEQKVD